MSMYNRKNVEPAVIEETKVWECTSDSCNCWVRDNFKSGDQPTCPLCKSEMQQATKELQVIHNPKVID